MITKLLLVLPLYLALFLIWYQFRHLTKIMASVEGVLNDVVDTPEEGIEQHEKQGELKDAVVA